MKKTLKIIGILLLILIIIKVIRIGSFIGKVMTTEPQLAAPEEYESAVETGGSIERKYLNHGAYEISYFEANTDEAWKKYEVYYPTILESSNEKYPVIIMTNGSGVRGSRYPAVFKHYASWGFIVIGNEHDTSFSGTSTDASLDYLLQQNDNPNSILYHKIDLNNIGVVGHSQGGVGVFNAITTQPHSDMYKVAVSLSPVPEQSAAAIKWDYDASKIKIPIMVLAGTENDSISLEQLELLYSHIGSDKIMARRTKTNHS